MNPKERLTRVIEELKAKISEPELLNLENCDDELYTTLAELGQALCTKIIPTNSQFYLLDSPARNAVGIHSLSSIVVFKGMLDFIFRIASLATAVTPCPTAPPDGAVNPWKENVGFWLEEGPFFFDNEDYWWLRTSEHRLVFELYVKNLFQFIVLHEIGHFHHLHDERKKRLSEILGQDTINGKIMSSSEDYSLHVREISADTFAFQVLWDESAYDITDLDSDAEDSLDVTIALRSASFMLTLEIVQLYFWLSVVSASGNTSFALAPGKYPPQAFRLQAVEATALEHAGRKIPPFLARMLLQQSMEQTRGIARKVIGDDDFLNWREKLKEPGFEEHYAIICKNMPAWSNKEFGKFEPT